MFARSNSTQRHPHVLGRAGTPTTPSSPQRTLLFNALIPSVHFSHFYVLRTLNPSCAASHVSQRVRLWRGTTPTTAGSCPALQREDALARPSALRGVFTRPSLCSMPAQALLGKVGPNLPKIGGHRFIDDPCFDWLHFCQFVYSRDELGCWAP